MLPKTLFQNTVKDADKFKEITRPDGFKAALLFAQAETIARHPMNEDRLFGMKVFMDVLVDLGEQDTPLSPPPDKSLRHDIAEQRNPKK